MLNLFIFEISVASGTPDSEEELYHREILKYYYRIAKLFEAWHAVRDCVSSCAVWFLGSAS